MPISGRRNPLSSSRPRHAPGSAIAFAAAIIAAAALASAQVPPEPDAPQADAGPPDDGQRQTDDGQRQTDDGQRSTDDGQRSTDDGDPSEVAVTTARQPAHSIAAVLGNGPLDKLTLVGASGELYRPGGSDRWERRSAGGVSITVTAAFGGPGGAVFVVGDRAPLFVRRGALWAAQPLPNRGNTVSARGGRAVVAVGRHIYALQGAEWRRRASVPRTVTALYAGRTPRTWAATGDGRLFVGSGARLAQVPVTLEEEEYISDLYGAGANLLGRTSSGRLLQIERNRVAELPLEGDLVGFEPHAGGSGPAGSLLLAGTVTGSDGNPTPALVSYSAGKLAVLGPLWPLQPKERFSVVYTDPTGDLLIATSAGRARARKKESQQFRTLTVENDLPDYSGRAPGRTPARAR